MRVLEVSSLKKMFNTITAVEGLSFNIQPGQIMGLIGQNGSGKTTTFRMILDLLIPDEGYAKWDGQLINKSLFSKIGYLPEERGLYPEQTIEKQLIFFAELKGKSKEDIVPKIDYWLDKFEVKGSKTDKVNKLSKGNQQKVQLIQTLIHEPDLIILDEPFSGLDPVNASLLEDSIKEEAERGACIIFSSHNMNNVEELCDTLVMLKNGKQVLGGTLGEIRQKFGRTKVFLEAPVSSDELHNIPGVNQIVERVGRGRIVYLDNEETGRAVYDLATKDGYIYQFSQQPPSLDEIFKEMAGGEK